MAVALFSGRTPDAKGSDQLSLFIKIGVGVRLTLPHCAAKFFRNLDCVRLCKQGRARSPICGSDGREFVFGEEALGPTWNLLSARVHHTFQSL